MIWSIPGTGFSGALHLVAKRPYLLAVGLAVLGLAAVPAVPLLSPQTLPPRVFAVPPPPPLIYRAENIKHKNYRVASKVKRTTGILTKETEN